MEIMKEIFQELQNQDLNNLIILLIIEKAIKVLLVILEEIIL